MSFQTAVVVDGIFVSFKFRIVPNGIVKKRKREEAKNKRWLKLKRLVGA